MSNQAKEQKGVYLENFGTVYPETERELPLHQGVRFYYAISYLWPANTQHSAADFLNKTQPTISNWCKCQTLGPKRRALSKKLESKGINVKFIYDETGKEPLLLKDRERIIEAEEAEAAELKNLVIQLQLKNNKQAKEIANKDKTIKRLEGQIARFQESEAVA